MVSGYCGHLFLVILSFAIVYSDLNLETDDPVICHDFHIVILGHEILYKDFCNFNY